MLRSPDLWRHRRCVSLLRSADLESDLTALTACGQDQKATIRAMCDQAIEAIQRGDMLAAFDVWDEMLNGDVFPYHNLFHNFTGSNDCAPAPLSPLCSSCTFVPLSLCPSVPLSLSVSRVSVPLTPSVSLALLALLPLCPSCAPRPAGASGPAVLSAHADTSAPAGRDGPSGPVARVHLALLGLTALHGLQTTTC